MESFLEAFFAVDKDNSESITRDELVEYMEQNNFKPAFVDKWMNIFDEDGDNIITLDEFCRALGLEIDDARTIRRNSEANLFRWKVPAWVEIIAEDMPLELQKVVIEMSSKCKRDNDSEREWARTMKANLDANYGRIWHVFVCRGDHWLHYSHEPGNALHFRVGQYTYLVWKTPGY